MVRKEREEQACLSNTLLLDSRTGKLTREVAKQAIDGVSSRAKGGPEVLFEDRRQTRKGQERASLNLKEGVWNRQGSASEGRANGAMFESCPVSRFWVGRRKVMGRRRRSEAGGGGF